MRSASEIETLAADENRACAFGSQFLWNRPSKHRAGRGVLQNIQPLLPLALARTSDSPSCEQHGGCAVIPPPAHARCQARRGKWTAPLSRPLPSSAAAARATPPRRRRRRAEASCLTMLRARGLARPRCRRRPRSTRLRRRRPRRPGRRRPPRGRLVVVSRSSSTSAPAAVTPPPPPSASRPRRRPRRRRRRPRARASSPPPGASSTNVGIDATSKRRRPRSTRRRRPSRRARARRASAASAANAGAMLWHGPHHVAEKSTTTGTPRSGRVREQLVKVLAVSRGGHGAPRRPRRRRRKCVIPQNGGRSRPRARGADHHDQHKVPRATRRRASC